MRQKLEETLDRSEVVLNVIPGARFAACRAPVLQPPVARKELVEELPLNALGSLDVCTPFAHGGLVLGVVEEHLSREKNLKVKIDIADREVSYQHPLLRDEIIRSGGTSSHLHTMS